MSELTDKLHYSKSGTTDEIKLYSTLNEVQNNGLNVKINNIQAYAGLGSSSDSNKSNMSYKNTAGTTYSVLKQVDSQQIFLNCLAYRNDEATLIQALPVLRVNKGDYIHYTEENAPSISGYNFVSCYPNCFYADEDTTIKFFYISQSVFDRNRTNWYGQYQAQTITPTDLFLTDYCNTVKATNMDYMFYQTNIERAPKMNMSKVTKTQRMFAECPNLKEFNGEYYDLSAVSVCNRMFQDCPELEYLNIRTMTNIQWMTVAFTGNRKLKEIVLPEDMSLLAQTTQMLQQCEALTTLDFSNTKLGTKGLLESMSLMCYCCYNLKTVDFTNCDFSSCTNWSRTFHDCKKLEEVIGEIDLRNCTNIDRMLAGTTLLTTPIKFKNVPRALDFSAIGSDAYTILNYID